MKTQLVISICIVLLLLIFQVFKNDPQVEKLDWLKDLFGIGNEDPEDPVGGGTTTTTCVDGLILDNDNCLTLAQYCHNKNGTPNTRTFNSDNANTWCVLNSTGSGSTGSGSTGIGSTGSGSTGSGSTADPDLLHHYDFNTSSLTEQVHSDPQHTLQVKSQRYGLHVGPIGEIVTFGSWGYWLSLDAGCILETITLPRMPKTGNYTTQLEFWSNGTDTPLTEQILGFIPGISLNALWGKLSGGGVAESDYTQIQMYGFNNSNYEGFIQMKNQSIHPPHQGTGPNPSQPDSNGYRVSPLTQVGGTWDDETELVLHRGRHVITGAYNFNQDGPGLIANIGYATLYLDNRKLSDEPINPDMTDPMMFQNGSLPPPDPANAASDGILKIQNEHQRIHIQHIRMYEGVITQDKLDTLTNHTANFT